MKYLIIISLTWFITACSSDEPIVEPVDPKDTITVSIDTISDFGNLLIWQAPFYDNEEGNYAYPTFPRLIGSNVITSSDFDGLSIDSYKNFRAFDKNTGENVWEYYDPIITKGIIGGGTIRSPKNENASFEGGKGNIFKFNALTGSLDWHFKFSDWFDNSFEYNEYIPLTNNILTFSYKTKNYGYTAAAKIDIDTGEPEEIFRIVEDTLYQSSLLSPVTRILANGDTLIYALDRKTAWSGVYLPQAVDLHCYNITQNEYVWSKFGISPTGNCSVYSPHIDEESNSIIVLASDVISYDLDTGNENWRTSNLGYSLTSNYIVADGKVFSGTPSGDYNALDKFTGEIVWNKNDYLDLAGLSGITYYNKMFLFTNDARGLAILNSDTGEEILRAGGEWLGEVGDKRINYHLKNGVAVDEATNRAYVAGNKALFCFKIPE